MCPLKIAFERLIDFSFGTAKQRDGAREPIDEEAHRREDNGLNNNDFKL